MAKGRKPLTDKGIERGKAKVAKRKAHFFFLLRNRNRLLQNAPLRQLVLIAIAFEGEVTSPIETTVPSRADLELVADAELGVCPWGARSSQICPVPLMSITAVSTVNSVVEGQLRRFDHWGRSSVTTSSSSFDDFAGNPSSVAD
jgi:hypothetical protein